MNAVKNILRNLPPGVAKSGEALEMMENRYA
jgi:hypothetical protein